MTEHIVELHGMVFDDLIELCSSLAPEEWDLPTDCPGWTVKDNISHLAGTEALLLGRPAPDHEVGRKAWVRNPVGENNEVAVDYRRSWTPEQVLEEFREIAGERMKGLRALTQEDLAADSWTPIGPGTVRDLLNVRVMDFWVHEQDIRRAVGEDGGLDTPVAAHAFGRHRMAIPFVVGKKAEAKDGTTVVVEVEGQEPFGVRVEGKRANLTEELPEKPNVKLSTDLDTFNRLCTGRGDPEPLRAKVRVEGDAKLAKKILENINFMI
jgi:uncharacterized protein (TIGR03083 family)